MYRGKGRESVAWNSALTYDMIFTQPVVYELDRLQMPTLLLIGEKDNTAIGKDAAPAELKARLGNYAQLGKDAARRIPQRPWWNSPTLAIPADTGSGTLPPGTAEGSANPALNHPPAALSPSASPRLARRQHRCLPPAFPALAARRRVARVAQARPRRGRSHPHGGSSCSLANRSLLAGVLLASAPLTRSCPTRPPTSMTAPTRPRPASASCHRCSSRSWAACATSPSPATP